MKTPEIGSVFIKCKNADEAQKVRVAISMYRLRNNVEYFYTEVHDNEVRLCKEPNDYGRIKDISMEAFD